MGEGEGIAQIYTYLLLGGLLTLVVLLTAAYVVTRHGEKIPLLMLLVGAVVAGLILVPWIFAISYIPRFGLTFFQEQFLMLVIGMALLFGGYAVPRAWVRLLFILVAAYSIGFALSGIIVS